RRTRGAVDRAGPADRLRSCCSRDAPAKLRGSGQCLYLRDSRVRVVFRVLFATVRVVDPAACLFFGLACHADFSDLPLLAELSLFPDQLRPDGTGATDGPVQSRDRRGYFAPLIYDVSSSQGTIRYGLQTLVRSPARRPRPPPAPAPSATSVFEWGLSDLVR